MTDYTACDDLWRECGSPWRAGMLGRCGAETQRVIDMSPEEELVRFTPDWTDAATVGALLGLVRDAWKAPRALVRLSGDSVSLHVFDVDCVTVGGNWRAWLSPDAPTEPEALLRALLAAPGRVGSTDTQAPMGAEEE